MNKTKKELIALIESMYTEEQKTEAYDQGFDFGLTQCQEGDIIVEEAEYDSLLKDNESLIILKDMAFCLNKSRTDYFLTNHECYKDEMDKYLEKILEALSE